MTTQPNKSLAPSQIFQAANSLHQQGHLAEAERLYRTVLEAQPDHFDALHRLGLVHAQQGKLDEAVRYIRRALSKNPKSAEALSDLGVALEASDRPAEAIPCYEMALVLRPDYAGAAFNLGNALQALGRHEEAIARFEAALALRRDHAEAHNNLGQSLHALDRHAEAFAQFEAALALKPGYAKAHNNLGVALGAAGRLEEAAVQFQRALAADPNYAGAHSNLGDVLCTLGRNEDALRHLERSLALEPNSADAHNNLGNALTNLRRYDKAIASYRRAVELDPLQGNARSTHVLLKRRTCDWSTFSRDHDELIDALGTAKRISPFVVVASTDDPDAQARAAKRYVEDLRLARLPALSNGLSRARDGKLRVAYLSADFHEHATAYLMAELFERHERRGFEVFAVSWGPDDGSDMRRRLVRSFDRFLDVRQLSDLDVAREMRALDVGLAVDLKGFTQECRPAILAHRPAPIQVNYLGYPGSMGARFIDYIVVDPFVVPPDQQPYFTERLVHLPDCYQVNDGKRQISLRTPSRTECGLPDQGFVFACFNNSYKITPRFFDVWMHLLRTIPGSVLWLLEHNEWAIGNLRREAEARGVSPDRLVISHAIASPTCSWTRCPTAPTRQRAMHCGQAYPCLRARDRASLRASRAACCARSGSPSS